MPRRNYARRGFAVLLALFAIAMLGALVTAIAFASAEETRASGISLRTSRVLSAAESAAWETLGTFDWNAAMNLRPGQYLRSESNGFAGPATVYVVRLDTTCFIIQTVASENPAGAQNSGSLRRVGITIEVGSDSAGRLTATRVPYRSWVELF